MITYENIDEDVKRVKSNGKLIGHIARNITFYGFADGWCITKCLKDPKWKGNYKKRKQAREALERLDDE